MLRLLATAVFLLRASGVVQRQCLSLAFRFRVYHMAKAFAKSSFGFWVFKMRPVIIWSLDRFVFSNCWC